MREHLWPFFLAASFAFGLIEQARSITKLMHLSWPVTKANYFQPRMVLGSSK